MGFVYILKDKSSSNRGLASLKTRIVLSVLLFALLIVGYYMDMIKPNNFWSLSQPVDKHKQTKPNNIDKMPVPGNSFESKMILVSKMSFDTSE